jgi:transcriptional regulator with XRE-family HTH domain
VDRLAELRESQGLTLRDLAKKSGVDANTINQVELGHRKPRPSTLRKLAKGLNVDIADFFRKPAVPLTDAPKEAGLPSVIDLVLDAAEKQALLERQAFARAKESKPLDQPIGQDAINQAFLNLLERSPGDVAEACTDLALRNVQLEQELARAREEIAALREREQAHS